MKSPFFSVAEKKAIVKQLKEDPGITPTQVGKNLEKEFSTKQLKSIGALKLNMKKRGELAPGTKNSNNKSILSDENHKKLFEILEQTPKMPVLEIAAKIGITDKKQIKCIYNTQYNFLSKKKKPVNAGIARVNRTYTRQAQPMIVKIHEIIPGTEISPKAIHALRNIKGLSFVQLAGRHPSYEVRELLPS